MKRRVFFLFFVIFCCTFIFSVSDNKKKNKNNQIEENVVAENTRGKSITEKIAIPVPKTINIENGADWIPIFFQGIITSNFQQYSGMNVIDRQNVDMVKAEQKLSENVEYSESDVVEFGKLINARLIIVGTIIEKSGSYALNFSITDIETGVTKATSSIPSCQFSVLENGEAANQISFQLMKNFGIPLSSDVEKKLIKNSVSEEISAQTNLAKGIVAENNGTNIEALTYYIKANKSDKKLREATTRMQNMSTIISSGNFGANAKNLIKLRKEWDSLLQEAAELIASNQPVFALYYNTDIHAKELTEEDYKNETMSFYVTAPALVPTDYSNRQIVTNILNALESIEERKNWGEKFNDFPATYFKEIKNSWLKKLYSNKSDKYNFTMNLLDANRNVIASKKIVFNVIYQMYKSDKYQKTYITYEGFPLRVGSDLYVTFDKVSVKKADTDIFYISVENNNKQEINIQPFKELTFEGTIKQCKEYIKNLKKTYIANGELKSLSFYNPICNLIVTGYENNPANYSYYIYEDRIDISFVSSIIFLGGIDYFGDRNMGVGTEYFIPQIVIPIGLKEIDISHLIDNEVIIKFRGSKEEWNAIKYKILPYNVSVIFDYNGILGFE
ncbi:MAG: penicillin-binding protein activator LpoB [Treponema sp.]|nr:penicillin-binding protein activator LpoB [Treponema sp.]